MQPIMGSIFMFDRGENSGRYHTSANNLAVFGVTEDRRLQSTVFSIQSLIENH